MKIKENKGVTLISLVIAIIVLLIIAGISIYNGKDVIKKANLEELRTNMLLIQAKAKEYVENANFKLGTKIDSIEDETQKDERIKNAKEELKGTQQQEKINIGSITIPSDDDETNYIYYYKLSKDDLADMGLEKIELENDEYYYVKYDVKNVQAEVYNTIGFDGMYSLSEIEKIEE